jgi:CheY-like chemotaxis protein
MTESNDATEAILLVDDNPTNLQLLFETLDGRGYKLLIAKDRLRSLPSIKSRSGHRGNSGYFSVGADRHQRQGAGIGPGGCGLCHQAVSTR